MTTIQQRQRDLIRVLENEFATWTKGDSAIQIMVKDFFQQLYTTRHITGSETLVGLISHLVTDEINAMLLVPLSNDEVKKKSLIWAVVKLLVLTAS